jgi:hypothetical protein
MEEQLAHPGNMRHLHPSPVESYHPLHLGELLVSHGNMATCATCILALLNPTILIIKVGYLFVIWNNSRHILATCITSILVLLNPTILFIWVSIC